MSLEPTLHNRLEAVEKLRGWDTKLDSQQHVSLKVTHSFRHMDLLQLQGRRWRELFAGSVFLNTTQVKSHEDMTWSKPLSNAVNIQMFLGRHGKQHSGKGVNAVLPQKARKTEDDVLLLEDSSTLSQPALQTYRNDASNWDCLLVSQTRMPKFCIQNLWKCTQ